MLSSLARYRLRRFFRLVLLLPPLLLLAALLVSSHQLSTLEQIKKNGTLRVITIAGPVTYYEDAKGPTGFEYLLAKGFADSLGVELEVTLMDNLNGVLIALGGPNGDMAAAGLTITPKREERARFSTPYNSATEQLIYRLGSKRPKTLDDLDPDGLMLVIADSAHSDRMHKLKAQHPDLKWEEYKSADMLELMELIHNDMARYAIVDSTAYVINRGLYPKARVAFSISDPQPLAWAFPNHGDRSLLDAANRYLQQEQDNGNLAQLEEQFFGHADTFSVAGSQLFIRRTESRLPTYEAMFRQVAEDVGMDWHLLAAIAYQESHWNPKAKSPTGVRGLMMLTRATAKEMGIKNRLDPTQSLNAGARYFLKSKARIPERITEPDRTWMALASYNVGYGHLEDARVLTERGGKNPDLWEDVKQFLPLLEQKKYYSTLRYGFARGREPVSYVQNIRHYRDILHWRTMEMEREEQRQQELDPLIWEVPF